VNGVKAIGFDLDGTLFDHRGSAATGVDEFFLQFGIASSDAGRRLWFAAEEAEFERWRAGEVSFQEQRRNRLRRALPGLGLSAPEHPAELDGMFEDYLRAYRAAWTAFPDSASVLAALRQRGFRLGVLTNGNHEQQLEKLTAVGLLDLVDVVCTSELIGFQKPDPRAFQTLAASLDAEPADCLFIGDNPEHDVAGARAAGMRAGLVDRYSAAAPGLRAVVESGLGLAPAIL
jgi:putative hydrolase of the HAD superfamily